MPGYRASPFLSTPSARRATLPGADSVGGDSVFLSTPSARRATADQAGDWAAKWEDFYPRPPRGGRRVIHLDRPRFIVFLSTPSARRATIVGTLRVVAVTISIHALREEGDPQKSPPFSFHFLISIHALREEGDPFPPGLPRPDFYFYPRPPRGGRRGCWPCAAVP